MTRQWIRQCRLYIGNGSEAVDLSSMRIRFNVERATVQTPERADITISNLSNETSNKIQKEYDNVVLQAGYDGNFSTIFEGQIVQKRGPARETPVDTYFNIQARAGQTGYSFAVVNKTLASGHTFQDQVDACLEAMKPYGITAGSIPDLSAIKIPRGRALFGMARNQLRSICQSVGASWWIEGTKLNILKNDDVMSGSAIVLDSETGMIGMPVQTMDGVEVRCLLNPNLKLGGTVKIDEASIQKTKLTLTQNYSEDLQRAQLESNIAADGLYQIRFLSHVGDTRGTEWYSDMSCIPVSGTSTSKRANTQSMAPTSPL